MKLSYKISHDLPALSWLAVLAKGEDVVEVTCGNAVVTRNEWFASGVWNGELEQGEMDACSCCCCTGMKLDSKSVVVKIFVSVHFSPRLVEK